MDENHVGTLIESIYSSAFEQDGWDRLAQNLRVEFGASQIATVADSWADETVQFGYATADPSCAGRYLDYYHKCELILPIYRDNVTRLSCLPVFSTDLLIERDAHFNSEMYQDFLKDYDMSMPLVGMLEISDDKFAHFIVHRPFGRDCFNSEERELLAALTPHLHRGLRIYREMEGLRAKAGAFEDALDAHGAATFMLDAAGKLLFLNQAAGELLKTGLLTLRDGCLIAAHPHDDAALQAALRPPQPGVAPAEIMLRGPACSPALRLAITPVNGGGIPLFFDVTQSARAAFLVTAAPLAPTAENLMASYALTHAEAEITLLLLSGSKAAEIAAGRNTSPGTVHTQLNKIYAKMGVASHVELLVKLMRP